MHAKASRHEKLLPDSSDNGPGCFRFRSLIEPLSTAEFFTRFWAKGHFLSKGQSARFSSLFSWEILSEILSTHRFEYPRLRLLHSGRVISPEKYMLERADRRGNPYRTHDTAKVQRLIEDGAMLHLTSVGETWKPLADATAHIEREICGHVQINLHAGFAGARGFHTHWDGHDVYAAQIDGSKAWRLFGFTAEAPLAVPPDQKHGAPENSTWEGTLTTGDML